MNNGGSLNNWGNLNNCLQALFRKCLKFFHEFLKFVSHGSEFYSFKIYSMPQKCISLVGQCKYISWIIVVWEASGFSVSVFFGNHIFCRSTAERVDQCKVFLFRKVPYSFRAHEDMGLKNLSLERGYEVHMLFYSDIRVVKTIFQSFQFKYNLNFCSDKWNLCLISLQCFGNKLIHKFCI